MSKTKIFRPSTDAMTMMIQTERVPGTGVHETVNSIPSSKYDTSAYFLEYISY